MAHLDAGGRPPNHLHEEAQEIGWTEEELLEAVGNLALFEFQSLIASNPSLLLKNLAEQFARYAAGREVSFSDREEVARVVERTQKQGGGIRALIHEVVQSGLFQTH